MMFWFNKWYSKQRNDYNAVVRLILIGGFRLPDSYSPTSTLTRSRFSTHTAHLLQPFSPASQLTLLLASLCLFPSFETRVPKRPWPGSRRHFPRNYPLKKKTEDTLMYSTMPRLSRHCLWFGRYLRPFVHDTTFGHPAITSALRCGLQFRYRRMRRLRRWGPKTSWSRRSSTCA